MIDLKRNSKKELVPATGKRVRASSIYKPNQNEDFKISRGKFSDFLTCPRCFYMDRVMGLDSPGTPGWTLNETTDLLLKKEFDLCRETQSPHRLFLKNGFTTAKLFPPTYDVLEFLEPAPATSKPRSHLPPNANLSSVRISLLLVENIFPILV